MNISDIKNNMMMNKLKKAFLYTPEFAISFIAVYWFVDNLKASPSQINYIMITILFLVLLLLISRNKIIAFILSLTTAVGSLYMLMAVFSEFMEFSFGDVNGLKFLFIWISIFLAILFMSILLPFKYIRKY